METDKKEQTRLHFTRVRADNNSGFFDPLTDLRRIVPAVYKLAAAYLEDTLDGPDREDALYLDNCLHIMELRLFEDEAPLEDQMREFYDAVGKAPARIRMMWFAAVNELMLSIYALFCRRDAAVDIRELKAMLEFSRFAKYTGRLTPELRAQVKEQLGSQVTYHDPAAVSDDSYIVCAETGEYLNHARELAGRFLAATGDQSWSGLAAACDREFSSGRKHSRAASLALLLAYPDYNHRTLTVEESGDGPDPEAGTPENA